jgi:hypothetical protein
MNVGLMQRMDLPLAFGAGGTDIVEASRTYSTPIIDRHRRRLATSPAPSEARLNLLGPGCSRVHFVELNRGAN